MAFFGCSKPLRASAARVVRPSRSAAVVVRAEAATVSEARRLLATSGWERAWIDGVSERISRHQITASVQQLKAVVDTLDSMGLPSAKAEHMVAIAWNILNRTPEQLEAVYAYLQKRGVADPAKVLFNHPKMLEYDVSGDGKVLQKGERSCIQLDVIEEEGQQKVLVSYFRPKTAFKTAPVSPWTPLDA